MEKLMEEFRSFSEKKQDSIIEGIRGCGEPGENAIMFTIALSLELSKWRETAQRNKTRENELERFCQGRESWGEWETRIIDTLFDLTCPAPLSVDDVRFVLSALLSAETAVVEHAENVAEETELPFPVAVDVVLKSAILGVYLKIREIEKSA